MDYARILDQIEQANITPREYRAARRMLDRATDQGILFLERADAYDLFGTNTWGDVRRMLTALRDAGLLDFHTNDCAYVNFCRAKSAQPRADSAQPRAESARDGSAGGCSSRAESAQPRADSAQPRADSARGAAPNKELNTAIRQAIQIHPDSLPDSQPEEGSGETTAPSPAPDPAEQARSIALLTDPAVGCDPRLAAALAAAHPFAEIRRQIPRYLADLARGRVRSPAVLRRRLDGHFAAIITANDRASPLWARHPDPSDPPPPAAEPDPYADLTL